MTDRRLSFAYPTSAPLSIAVLDQDASFREKIVLPILRQAGFQAHGIASAAALYRIMLTHRFDIVVLDADLPDDSGYNVTQHLRASSDIGIVMLTSTAWRHAPIQAFNSGADFYIPKPVDMALLTATLRSLGRRLTHMHTAVADRVPLRGWRLEADGWRLVSPNGGVVALTSAEHSLVSALVMDSGHIVTREALIKAIAHNAYDFDPHRLEMTIHRLRRKALHATGETLPLRTVRGKGYVFSCDTL